MQTHWLGMLEVVVLLGGVAGLIGGLYLLATSPLPGVATILASMTLLLSAVGKLSEAQEVRQRCEVDEEPFPQASAHRTRANLGHKLMCKCGCNQILLECNHVGCSYSTKMRDQLMAGLTDPGAIDEIDTLVIESTYLEDETEMARQFSHLTAQQAAELAVRANVRHLILTHISRRYREKDVLKEAQAVHPNVSVARDFDTYQIKRDGRD